MASSLACIGTNARITLFPLQSLHCWPLGVHGSPSFLSLLGLQDKLNKRDKEVAALTSQMDMLRAQVSGKSPSLGVEVGGWGRLALWLCRSS